MADSAAVLRPAQTNQAEINDGTTQELEQIFSKLPWSRLTLSQDDTGLQTFVVAVK